MNERSSPDLRAGERDGSADNIYIDCVLLHSPFPDLEQTLEAWTVLERYVPHTIRTLGISNTSLPPVLRIVYGYATVKPSVVQNRFHPATGYDIEMREYCRSVDVIYESHWTLMGNPALRAAWTTILEQFKQLLNLASC